MSAAFEAAYITTCIAGKSKVSNLDDLRAAARATGDAANNAAKAKKATNEIAAAAIAAAARFGITFDVNAFEANYSIVIDRTDPLRFLCEPGTVRSYFDDPMPFS